MPRLSLYRPTKGNDYKFIDKNIWEQFQVGGTEVFVHKYIGPGESLAETPATPKYNGILETNIQDILFLENRDRKYDSNVYILRGIYNIQTIDFNLSQFGLFLQNDTIYIVFHINDTVEKLGRKIISGDVFELPHLKDDYALNDLSFALKRFYVVEEVTRAAEGFSVTWYPHLYRAKCKPIVDSQEFKDILDQAADGDNFQGEWNEDATYYPGDIVIGPDGKKYRVIKEVKGIPPPNSEYYELAETLRDVISVYETEMKITQAIMNQADFDAPLSGTDTTKFYTLTKGEDGLPELVTVDTETYDASVERQATDADGNLLFDADGNPQMTWPNASSIFQTAVKEGYSGYLYSGDGILPNGAPFTAGIAFPLAPSEGEFCLRKDFLPHRLFRFDGRRWVKVEDSVRMTMNNLGSSDLEPGSVFADKDVRKTQKTTFINNTAENIINNRVVKERQSLSQALRPQADE